MKVNDTVRIKKYPKGSINEKGRVQSIREDGLVWVVNLNMPFSGTVSAHFKPEELEVLK